MFDDQHADASRRAISDEQTVEAVDLTILRPAAGSSSSRSRGRAARARASSSIF